jgi:TonB family protein
MSFSSTPRVVTRIDPPPTGQTGAVVVKVSVDPGGVVTDAQVVSANGGSEAAALDAARQWVFGPAPAAWATYIGFSFAGELPNGALPTSVGGNIRPPRKVADFKPFYPPEAQQARIQGVQIIEAIMGPSGDVIDAWALRGHEALIASAINAVLHWRFEPALLNGEPMPVKTTVTVNFTLDSAPATTGTATPVRDNAAARGEAMPPAQYGSATNWPPAAVRVGGEIRPPNKTVDVRAVYPDVAQKARVQGVVICDVLIGPDGKVADARIRRSIPLLDQAAIDAVRQWEFTPTLLNGNPVPIIMTVTVNFTLS